MTPKELQDIILQGENDRLEFKQSFNKTIIETLVAFSNTRGGKVLIGVDNAGSIKGVSITEETVQKWVNEIKQNTEPSIIPDSEILLINGKTIIVLSVIEYPVKPVSFIIKNTEANSLEAITKELQNWSGRKKTLFSNPGFIQIAVNNIKTHIA